MQNNDTQSEDGLIDGKTPTDGGGRVKRREVLGMTAGGLAAGAIGATGSAAADENDSETITILHDTHTHSNIGEVGEPPNIATYVTKIEELMDEYDNAIMVGNGDDLGPSIHSLFTEGDHIIDFLNEGYQLSANAIGNHEFDYGEENAEEQFNRSEFPWVSADLGPEEGEPVPGAERWIIEDADGVSVGIFGLAPPNITGVTSYPSDWWEGDKVEAAQEATDALIEEGADVVVCASHTDTPLHFDIAEEVDDLHTIVGSHWAEVYDEDEVWDYYDEYGTVISEVGDEFDYIGAVTLDAETGDLVDWDIHPTEEAEEHPDIVEMMEDLQAEIDDELGEPVGKTDVRLDVDRTVIEARDHPLGALATDMVLHTFDEAEVAFYNEGNFRGGETYPPGEMTMEDWFTVFAFGNTAVLFEIDGETLLETMQYRGVMSDEGRNGRPDQQIGGMQFEWNPHEGEADEDIHGGGLMDVDNMYVNGEPLELDRTYTAATNSWVKFNDGGYVPIHDLPALAETDITQAVNMGDYFQEKGIVKPTKYRHRMLRVDEDVGDYLEFAEDDGEVEYVFAAPETGLDIYPDTFRAITNHHKAVKATDAWMENDEVHVTFDHVELQTIATGPEYVDLRVFGGYEPDPDAYDYDTPHEAWRFHQMKGSVDASTFVDPPKKEIEKLQDTIASLEEEISDKEDEIDALESDVADRDGEIESLQAEVDEKEDEIDDLEDEIADLQADDNDDTPDNGDEPDDDTVPGFGPIAALAGAGAGAYGYKRLTETDTDAESE